jgi:23S rRNA (adenine2503-C2)-methyltransferase
VLERNALNEINPPMPPVPLLAHGLNRRELTALFTELGHPRFRARQLWDWLYRKRAVDWAQMTNLSVPLREALAARLALTPVEQTGIEGAAGQTRKLVLRLRDGEQIEAVLIPAASRRTVCVSTQAGCRFHCSFCASGQAGFFRDLEAGEIVGQVMEAARAFGERPTHVVYMGIGEPLDNYDAVLKSIRILNDPDGMGIGARRITISTCGIVPGIQRLGEEGIQVELSVSLHAPNDELRSALMPVNRRYPLRLLLDSCGRYARRTGRIVTFEYTLIRGVNDAAKHAETLARLLKPLPCRVNLIPLSTVEEFGAEPSGQAAAELFINTLGRYHINATLRDSRGCALKAACGQLRYRHGVESRGAINACEDGHH